MGFVRGVANPCCFVHPSLGLKLVVHGDDFTCSGTKAALDWYEDQLQKSFEIKIRGRLGYEPGCLREMRILNRIVRLDDHGLAYEPDPRHSEILTRSIDLGENTRVTPGDKPTAMKQDDEPHDDHDRQLFPRQEDAQEQEEREE